MASHSNYWSLSEFAGWIRKVSGAPKMLGAGTSKEWREYKKAAKAHSPFVYWLAGDALDGLQNFVCWPYDKLRDATYYYHNRFVDKQRYLSTGLTGEYIGIDRRILHALMETLVRFVEDESAWHEYICSSKEYKDQIPFYKRNWPFRHFTRFTFPELGLKHLSWAAALTMDKDWGVKEGDPDFGKPTHQAVAAQEILDIYHWWKNVRPLRKDPYDESGWSAYCDENRAKDDDDDCLGFLDKDETPEERDRVKAILDVCTKLEEQHEQEDEDMMVRVIKVRQHLWT